METFRGMAVTFYRSARQGLKEKGDDPSFEEQLPGLLMVIAILAVLGAL